MTVKLRTAIKVGDGAAPVFEYSLAAEVGQVMMSACRHMGVAYSPAMCAYLKTGANEMRPLVECDTLGSYNPTDGCTLYVLARAPTVKKENSRLVSVSDYECLSRIGGSRYASVHVARSLKTGETVVVKYLQSGGDVVAVLKEIEGMKVSGPNVLAMSGWAMPTRESPYAAMFMEYFENGSLGRVVGNGLRLDNTHLQIVMYGLAEGLMRAHRVGVYHRNVKPENVLLNKNFEPVIADFGLAKIVVDEMEIASDQSQDAIRYLAPEVIARTMQYEKVDQFGYAMTLYAVLTGEPPFREVNMSAFAAAISEQRRPPISESFPPAYRQLLTEMWAQAPSDRPSFEDVVARFQQGILDLPGVNKAEFNKYVAFLRDHADGSKMSNDEEIAHLRKNGVADALIARGKQFVESNIDCAVKYFLAAASLGHADCYRLVANACQKANRPSEFLKYLKMGADAGDDEARVSYAKQCLAKGMFPEAVQYLNMSVTQGNPEACYLMGTLYRDGKGVPQNRVSAAKMFKFASDKAFPMGQVEWSLCLVNGKGTRQNVADGIRLLDQLAKQGNPAAQCELGAQMFEHGKKAEGLMLIEQAMTQNYTRAKHMFLHYSDNAALVAQYSKQLAEAGDVTGMRVYGQALMTGTGVEADPQNGMKWLQQAVAKGDAQAEYLAAMAYVNGSGVQKDFNAAKKLMLDSSMHGYAPAQFSIANWYLQGLHQTPKNLQNGAKWMKTAADTGYIPAIKGYAICLEKGWGVIVNSQEAAAYRAKAESLSKK